MADNLSIAVTADVTSLRAQMALAQSSLRAYTAELRNTANAARQSGGISDPNLGRAAAQYQAASAEVAKLKTELAELGGKGKEAAESLTERFRLFPGVVLRARESITSLKEAAEAAGAAFAVEKIVDWSLEAAEAGEKAVNMAAAIGTSTQRFSELSGMMQLAGGSGDSLVRTMQIVAQKTEEALQNPVSSASQAFAELGVNSEALEDALKDPTTMVDRLADGFKRLTDAGRGGEAIAALRQIMGRGNAEAVKLFREGPEGLDRMRQAVLDTGAVIDTDLGEKMSETMDKVHQLGLAFQGLKNSVYEGLRDPLNEVLEETTKIIENLGGSRKLTGSEKEQYWPSEWGPYDPEKRLLSPYIPAISGLFSGTQASAASATAPIVDKSGGMRSGGALDLIERYESHGLNIPNFRYDKTHTASGYFQLTNTNWRNYGPGLGIDTSLYPTAMSAPYDLQRSVAGRMFDQSGFAPWANFNPGLKAAIGGGAGGASPERSFEDMQKALEAMWAAQRQAAQRAMAEAQRKLTGGDTSAQGSYDKAAGQYRSVAEAQANYAQMAGDPKRRDELIAYVTANAPKATAAYYQATSEMNALDADLAKSADQLAAHRVQAAERAAEARRRVETDYVKEYQAGIAAQVKSGDLTPAQGFGYNRQLITGTSQSEIDQLRSLLSMPGITPDEKTGIDASISEISAGAKAQLAELQKTAEEAGEAAAEKFAKPFTSEFDKIGSTLTSSITNALEHKKGQHLGLALRDDVISGGVNILGSGLNKAGGSLLGGKPGEGVGDVLGDKIGGWVSQIVLQVTATTANTAAVTANTAAVATSATASATGGALSAAGNAGGIFGGISSAFSFVKGFLPFGEKGYDVPSFAGGGWSIPGGLSMLHPKEMVLPANLAQGVRNMVAGGGSPRGGGGMHFYNNFGAFTDAAAIQRAQRPMVNQLRREARALIPT